MAIATVKTDFHQWTIDTAEAIRERRFQDVDWEEVAEEIRSLGRAEQNELRSRVSQLMYHLLKVQYQPERAGASWELTICEQRRRIAELLEEQPSLKATLRDLKFWRAAYSGALALAGPENLPDTVTKQFPKNCPFALSILESPEEGSGD